MLHPKEVQLILNEWNSSLHGLEREQDRLREIMQTEIR